MNEQPRQKLREIVARHGPSVAHDARRCEGLLKDYSAQYRREVSVLVSALEEHIPQDLSAAPAGTPRRVLLTRLARRLADHRGLSETAASWSVNSWALALGLISDDELKAVEEAVVEGTTSKATPTREPADAVSVVVSASGDGDYASIDEALRHVAAGGRILVRPGVYEEGIVLDKRVNIVGDGPREKVIVMVAGASCLTSSAEAARVAGLTLRGAADAGGGGFFVVDVTRGELVLEACDISSESISCVAAHGPDAAPIIKGCRIHDSADSGLYLFDGAAATIEDCEVSRSANVGVAVTGGASAVIRRTQIYGGAHAGVVVWQDATALLEECDVHGNRLANLGVSERAKLTARACRIHEGQNSGVFVHLEGEAVLEDCELRGHAEAEAAVTTRGRLFLNDCRVRDGQDSGVLIRDGGQALLQACSVSGNSGAGVSVGGESVLAVLASHINGNARHAVEVAAGATARVEDSDLTGNGMGPWDVEYGAEVESARNTD
ncbi:MAG: right-handed parallel beta-helix repeat-containing protein [Pyrinomonadaceae bacterium]